MAAPTPFGYTGLSIIGLGTGRPPYNIRPEDVDEYSLRHFEQTPAMKKVLGINKKTGIKTRGVIAMTDHPILNMEKTAHMGYIHDTFVKEGIPMATTASRQAIEEAGIDMSEITHVVAATCTDTAHPGFDHWLIKSLGFKQPVERVLLHGTGCSGSLAAMRTASELALGHAARQKPARILCVALEIASTLIRAELDYVHNRQQTRIAATIFADGASALVVSNSVGRQAEPIYDIVGWHFDMIPDSDHELAFTGDDNGWHTVLTPAVPNLTGASVPPALKKFLKVLPCLPSEYKTPTDFDWAIHPGGAAILEGIESHLKLTKKHTRASWDYYANCGNTSSATLYSVLKMMTTPEMDAQAPGGRPKEYVIGAAFGPGITVELSMLKRNMNYKGRAAGLTGLHTPPETSMTAAEEEAEQRRLHTQGFGARSLHTMAI